MCACGFDCPVGGCLRTVLQNWVIPMHTLSWTDVMPLKLVDSAELGGWAGMQLLGGSSDKRLWVEVESTWCGCGLFLINVLLFIFPQLLRLLCNSIYSLLNLLINFAVVSDGWWHRPSEHTKACLASKLAIEYFSYKVWDTKLLLSMFLYPLVIPFPILKKTFLFSTGHLIFIVAYRGDSS